ncbi:MAG: type III-B CRISPR module RAMP protein Cmr6 [Paraglaciecola sp.]|nr:type III-B CRISPR module RAMP protein Cmr6 [Paraglaciecola sp.]
MLPFYKAEALHPKAIAAGQSSNVNLGLFFSRFFSWTEFDTEAKSYKDDKAAFLKQFFLNSYGSQEQINRAVLRQMLLNSQQPSRYSVLKSDWHWVTGMGNNHPLENGFCWHHTLSLPYLPGSSVKGLVRAFCELNGMPKTRLLQWFGSESKDPAANQSENQAGELVFFDAIPCDKADILPDIMTPHSGDWQQEGGQGKTAPADWHDPVPVPFLVSRNLTLLFSVAKASHATMPENELDEVLLVLEQALGFFGAGAKTASGYGSMSPSIAGLKKAEQARDNRLTEIAAAKEQRVAAAAIAQMSENEKIIAYLQQDLIDPSKNEICMAQIKSLVEQGDALSWPLADRIKLVQLLKASKYMEIKNKDKLKVRKAALAQLEQN